MANDSDRAEIIRLLVKARGLDENSPEAEQARKGMDLLSTATLKALTKYGPEADKFPKPAREERDFLAPSPLMQKVERLLELHVEAQIAVLEQTKRPLTSPPAPAISTKPPAQSAPPRTDSIAQSASSAPESHEGVETVEATEEDIDWDYQEALVAKGKLIQALGISPADAAKIFDNVTKTKWVKDSRRETGRGGRGDHLLQAWFHPYLFLKGLIRSKYNRRGWTMADVWSLLKIHFPSAYIQVEGLRAKDSGQSVQPEFVRPK